MMETKTILIGLLIGLLVGAGVGYIASPSPDITGYEDQIAGLNAQVATLQGHLGELQEDYSKAQDELEKMVSAEDYDALEKQVGQLQSELMSTRIQLGEKEETIEELQQTITYLEGMVPSPPPSEGEPGSSRFFPADIGETITCPVTYRYENYTLLITVSEIIRGSSAWQKIYATNKYNDPPLEGMEYILAKIRVKYISGPTPETVYEVDHWDYEAVSEDGYVYDRASIVLPEPEIDADLYPGASHEGWAAFQVYKTDNKPVLAYARAEYGAYWFKLHSGP